MSSGKRIPGSEGPTGGIRSTEVEEFFGRYQTNEDDATGPGKLAVDLTPDAPPEPWELLVDLMGPEMPEEDNYQARCTTEPETMFEEGQGVSARDAKAICAMCPITGVGNACFDHYMNVVRHTGVEQRGIWFGTSPRRRRDMRRDGLLPPLPQFRAPHSQRS